MRTNSIATLPEESPCLPKFPACNWVVNKICAIWKAVYEGIKTCWESISTTITSLSQLRSTNPKEIVISENTLSAPLKTQLLDLAKQRGIDWGKTGEVIADNLLETNHLFFVNSIAVSKEQHSFSEGEIKPSTTIRWGLQFSGKILEKPSETDLKVAMCALLGSEDPSGQNALRKVAKEFKQVDFYLSKDLQNLEWRFSNKG